MKLSDLPTNQLQQSQTSFQIFNNPNWLGTLLRGAPADDFKARIGAEFDINSNPQAQPQRPDKSEGIRAIVAILPEHHEAAERLARKRYESRGYRFYSDTDYSDTDLDSSAAKHQGVVTLLAEHQGRALGTVTIRVDSAQGLLAQQSYGREIEGMRDRGRSIGEVVKLAVEEGADCKPVLNALLQSAYLVAHSFLELTDFVIEVNPRHVRFYQRVFGFVVASAVSVCDRVGAPSVLLRLELDELSRKLKFAGGFTAETSGLGWALNS
jgi:hypothetical protein